MSKNSNILEINGKRYNATTGALLKPLHSNSATAKPDGPKQPAANAAKSSAHKAARKPGKQAASHAPAPSRTLMRQAVKKPGPSLKRRHKAQGHADSLALRALSEVIVKPSALRLDEQRLRHAKQIPHSRLISRFPALTSDTGGHREPFRAKASPAPAAPPVPAAKKPRTTADLLERAIERSTSHLEPLAKPEKSARHEHLKRNLGIGGVIGLSVIILGVIVTQNLANVRLQMASTKAGFNVSLPDYRPAGYDLGQLNYSQGAAAIQFNSNSDDLHYTITQKRSSWDSTALRNNFIAPSYAQYQAVQARGLTVYLYGDYDATWVNGGIWYVIQSDGSLNNRQLVDLATSLL